MADTRLEDKNSQAIGLQVNENMVAICNEEAVTTAAPLEEIPIITLSRGGRESAPAQPLAPPAMRDGLGMRSGRAFQDGERLAHLQTSRLPPQLNAYATAAIYDESCMIAAECAESMQEEETVAAEAVASASAEAFMAGRDQENAGGDAEGGAAAGGAGRVAAIFSFIRRVSGVQLPAVLLDGLGAPLPVDASPRGQAAGGQQPTFSCFICYESVPLSERYVASESASAATCPHLFCRACVRAYLTCRTEEGFIVNNCPMIGAEGCELVYGEADMRALVSEDVLRKYEKFKAMRSNANYRECPNEACHKLLLGDASRPAMVCDACSTAFCFLHSNAHPPSETCGQYARRTRKDEMASKRAIRKISRACPSCKAPTQKDGGCNHMRCRQCSHEWCWLCTRTYTDTHYAPTNLFGCPGSQFLDLDLFGQWTAIIMWVPRICLLLLIFPTVLALSIIAQAVWLPASLCLARSPLARNMPRVYFTLPFLGALLGHHMSYLLCGRILAFLVLVLVLIPLQLAWLPVGAFLGALIIALKAMRACHSAQQDLGTNCEIMAVSCFMVLGLWGLAVESLGFLSVFGNGPEDFGEGGGAEHI